MTTPHTNQSETPKTDADEFEVQSPHNPKVTLHVVHSERVRIMERELQQAREELAEAQQKLHEAEEKLKKEGENVRPDSNVESARSEYGDALLAFEKAIHGASTAKDFFAVKLEAERVARAAGQMSNALDK